MGATAPRRVPFANAKPYDVPGRLSDLRGPPVGVVELPLSVCGGPRHVFDLGRPGDLRGAYQALIRVGRLIDRVAGLNAEVLVAVWSSSLLPARVRTLWEEQLPELAVDVGYGSSFA